jgi:pyruvate formate lyase activating enzyme
MNIQGFNKLTLLDYPGLTACTVFTGGCDLRCPFCHNASLVNINDDTTVSEEEFFSFLKKRVNILDGVCITGGEPLLQKDIYSFISNIKALGFAVKLDTNGAYPEKLSELINAGIIDYVAMDIKNSKEKYAQTVGVSNLDITPYEKSVEILKNSGIDYEFRTTIVKELHDLSDIQKIGEWIKGAKKYFLQSFVDSGNTIKTGYSAHDKNTLEAFKQAVLEHISRVEIRGI